MCCPGQGRLRWCRAGVAVKVRGAEEAGALEAGLLAAWMSEAPEDGSWQQWEGES